jgi:hypothetical protein
MKAATLHRSDFVQQNAANTKTNTKPIVNAYQPNLPPEGVFDGFLYLRADP